MFEHLDDSPPFVPDDDFRRGVFRRGRQLRLRRRLAAAVTGLAVTVAGLGVAGALYVERRDAAIDRVVVQEQPSIDGATNILLVGTDSRIGFEEPGSDEVTGRRSDTMVIVRLQTDGSVALLPLPRDLQDPVTGERLNIAYNDGPQSLIDAINETTGLPIDHYVELDFQGFVALVDEFGGVELAVTRPLFDTHTGLHLGPTPCVTLDGDTALALARSRHIEGDETSDLGRMARGQAALAALIGQLSEASGDPATIDRLTRVLADHASLDDGLTLGRLAEVAHALASAGPDRVTSIMLPIVDHQTPEGASMLRLTPDAAAVLRTYGAPADFVVPPVPSGSGGGAGGGAIDLGSDPGIGPCTG
jgi:polyisoprenyl-teichoic acid--peptidoglycan teichoic acid transferase